MKNKNKKILVFNSGSSSLKLQVFDSRLRRIIKLHVDGIGKQFCSLKVLQGRHEVTGVVRADDHRCAVSIATARLFESKILKSPDDAAVIGHRVVHGGEISKTSLIDSRLLAAVRKFSVFAPLHNPPALEVINACRAVFPNIRQYAVFDTAFHSTITKELFLYGLPLKFYRKDRIRKYGFHGISHEFVSRQAIRILRKKNSRIVVCHLGNGSSITAVKNGFSVDTSMGFTPIDGLIMGTRPGHVDPGVLIYLMKKYRLDSKKLDTLLNKQSGFLGIAGRSDMREIKKAASKGDKNSALAVDMLAADAAFHAAGYAALLGGIDCIVFTAGIGENEPITRAKICAMLSHLGVSVDRKKNSRNAPVISSAGSRVKVFVIPTDEELAIAEKIKKII